MRRHFSDRTRRAMSCSGFAVAMLTILSGMAAICQGGEDPTAATARSARIEAKIAELDDERFAVREKAREELLEIGQPALSGLAEAAESDSPEQRIRAVELVEQIRFGVLSVEFEALGKLADHQIDVEHGMWLIARILDPDLEKQAITGKLDEMAETVGKAAGGREKLATLPPAEAVAVLTGVLKNDFGLNGDEVTYQHPDNSSVHRVMERKRGLPILLSEIAVAVARRLDLPIVGLGVPGRYMIKYDGSQAPAGQRQEDLIVNPFEGWEVVEPALLGRILGFDPRIHLEPSPGRATLVRMLNNMHSHALVQQQPRLAKAIRAYRVILSPLLPGEE